MKKLKKFAFLFVLLTVILVPGLTAEAAKVKVPGRVRNLSAKVKSETEVKLSWKKVSGATRYSIYQVDPDTGEKIGRVASTSKITYTVSNLKPNNTYSFVVYAKNKAGLSEKPSQSVTVSTKIRTPKQVTGLKVSNYGNKNVTLKWSSAKNATKYAVYQYNSSTKDYELVGTTKKTSYTVSNLKVGSTYKFRVRAYRRVNGTNKYGKTSKTVSAVPVRQNENSVSGRKYVCTLKSETTVTITSSKQKMTLKKGQKVYAPRSSKSVKTVTAQLADGRKFKIKVSKLKYTSQLYTTTAKYSKSTSENYVNSNKYTSSTGWLIWINQYTSTVQIFQGSKGNWKMKRQCLVVVGAEGHTPLGTFKVLNRTDYAYGKRRVYFTWNESMQWGNSFHRYINSTHRGSYSNGCIRMADSDLDYLADHCKPGTTVVSY